MSDSIYQPPTPEALPQTLGPVATLSWKERLFSFEGRFSRSQFWGYGFGVSYLVSFLVIIPIIPIFITLIAAEESGGTPNIPILIVCGLLTLAITVVSTWIYLAGTAKRFHDRGKSGHWGWLLLIPYIGAFWVIIECGCLEGMRNQSNRYGPDPLLR